MGKTIFYLTDGENITCTNTNEAIETLIHKIETNKTIHFPDGPRTQIIPTTQITHIEHYEGN